MKNIPLEKNIPHPQLLASLHLTLCLLSLCVKIRDSGAELLYRISPDYMERFLFQRPLQLTGRHQASGLEFEMAMAEA